MGFPVPKKKFYLFLKKINDLGEKWSQLINLYAETNFHTRNCRACSEPIY